MRKTLKVSAVAVLLILAISLGRSSYDKTTFQSINTTSEPQTKTLRALGYINGTGSKSDLQSADETQLETSSPKTTPSILQRKIIKSGEVKLVVKSLEPFVQGLRRQLPHLDGYIAEIQADKTDGSESGRLVLRVPPQKVDILISWLGEQGLVSSQNIKAEEISDQYYDLQARLENYQRFELRLLEMLKNQTGKLQDVMDVEEKLNQVREQIEEFQGKLMLFNNLTQLATITVNVSEQFLRPPVPVSRFATRALEAWNMSIGSLGVLGQQLLLGFIVIFPWLLPFAILMVAVRYLAKLIWRSRLKPKIS